MSASMPVEPGAAPPGSSGSKRVPTAVRARRLRRTSLLLSLVGVVLGFVLMGLLGSTTLVAFYLPLGFPALAVTADAALFVVALALAMVAKRATGTGQSAAVTAGVGLAVCMILLLLTSAWRHLGWPYGETELYSRELWESPATRQHPLPFGTEVELLALGTRQPALAVTVERPIDITEEALEAGAAAPVEGAYIAVPLVMRVIDARALSAESLEFNRDWLSWQSRWAGPSSVSLAGYQPLTDLDFQRVGPQHVYEIFDVRAEYADRGVFTWDLPASFKDGAVWGTPVDELIPVHDGTPAETLESTGTYGATVPLRSTVTGKDAASVSATAPVDVTDAARAASVAAPTNGAYIACPIDLQVDRSALADPDEPVAIPAVFLSPAGDEVPSSRIREAERVAIPGYPTANELDGLTIDERFSYFGIFDVPPGIAASCAIWLATREDGWSYTLTFQDDVAP